VVELIAKYAAEEKDEEKRMNFKNNFIKSRLKRVIYGGI
jgi:hypothetical protein